MNDFKINCFNYFAIITIYSFLGICYSAGFAGSDAYFIAWLAIAAFYFFYQRTHSPFLTSFIFAFAFHCANHSWIYHSIHAYGNLSPILSLFLTLCSFIMISLLFMIIMQALHYRFFNQSAISFAMLWTSYEWFTILFRLPWSQLSLTVVNSPIKKILPCFGLLGTNFIITIYLAWMVNMCQKKCWKRWIVFIFFNSILLMHINSIQWNQPTKTSLKIAAIQGNFTEFEKWDPNHLPTILQYYLNETMAQRNHDLIIWPEGAIPIAWQTIETTLKPFFQTLKQEKINLIFGVPENAHQSSMLYNTLILANHTFQFYRKENLVYFGEILPLSFLFNKLFSQINVPLPNYTYPIQKNKALVLNKLHTIAPAICFDIAFHQTMREFFPESNMIVTISDDAWFGNGRASAQHLQIAQAQSLVFARPQIFVGNSGLTAFINANGKVVKQLAKDIQDVLSIQIIPDTGNTIAQSLNDHILIFVLWFLFILSRSALLLKKNLMRCFI